MSAIEQYSFGLDAGIGWAHRDAPYRDSAALDLIEVWLQQVRGPCGGAPGCAVNPDMRRGAMSEDAPRDASTYSVVILPSHSPPAGTDACW